MTPILNNVKPEDIAPVKDVNGLALNKFEQFLAELKKRIHESVLGKR